MAVAAGLICVGTVGFASPDPTGVSNQNFEELLRKAERQISDGHTVTPPEDNAVDTWTDVLSVMSTNDTPAVRGTLLRFAAHLRSRADEERTAGSLNTASDFKVCRRPGYPLDWTDRRPDERLSGHTTFRARREIAALHPIGQREAA
jgi:hypothetical protein